MDIKQLQASLEQAITLAKSNPSDPAIKQQLAQLWDLCQEYQTTFETFVGL
jgi:hypothetical protein